MGRIRDSPAVLSRRTGGGTTPTPHGRSASAKSLPPSSPPLLLASPRKRTTILSTDQQATLLHRYDTLPKGKIKNPRALTKLCKDFNVERHFPARLARTLKSSSKLPTRKGAGGSKPFFTPRLVEELKNVLKSNAYDMTFEEMAEAIGCAKTTIYTFFKKTPGWRVVRKSLTPLLTPKHLTVRLKYAKKHRRSKFKNHVDIDEKWFNVFTHSRTLKLPSGVPKPRTPMASKRYIGKIMMLVAVARPDKKANFDGKVGIWRVAGPMVYKRRTTRKGIT